MDTIAKAQPPGDVTSAVAQQPEDPAKDEVKKMVANDTTQNTVNYSACVKNCLDLFGGETEALVACINGCASVNTPKATAVAVDGGDIRAHIERLGRAEFSRHLRAAAQNALSLMPDIQDSRKLDGVSRQYIERVTILIGTGSKAPDWDDAALLSFVENISWAKLSADIVVMAMDNGGGGSGGSTCVTRCRTEYNNCTAENQCDTSRWVCLCCAPCSLQYMGCVSRCVVGIGGLSRLTIT